MHSDVIADGTSKKFVEIDQASGHQWTSILGGNDQQVCVAIDSRLADRSSNVFALNGQGFELDSERSCFLCGGLEKFIGFASPAVQAMDKLTAAQAEEAYSGSEQLLRAVGGLNLGRASYDGELSVMLLRFPDLVSLFSNRRRDTWHSPVLRGPLRRAMG